MSDPASWRDVFQNLALLVGALTPIILAIMNRNQKKAAEEQKKAEERAVEDRGIVKQKLEQTNTNVDSKLTEIHQTVNGNTRELVDQITQLRAERDERDQKNTQSLMEEIKALRAEKDQRANREHDGG